MANQVFLGDDGFIHNLHVGDQTGKTVSTMVKQLAVLTEQLRANERPVLALIDLTKLGKHDAAARQAAADGIKNLSYDRAAAFSDDQLTRYVVNLVVRAAGRGDRFRYFDTEAEAVAFLKQGENSFG